MGWMREGGREGGRCIDQLIRQLELKVELTGGAAIHLSLQVDTYLIRVRSDRFV